MKKCIFHTFLIIYVQLFCPVKNDLDMFLCVGRTMMINVLYNQLDPLHPATGHTEGDANCETGYSMYPGNINQAPIKLKQ